MRAIEEKLDSARTLQSMGQMEEAVQLMQAQIYRYQYLDRATQAHRSAHSHQPSLQPHPLYSRPPPPTNLLEPNPLPTHDTDAASLPDPVPW